MNMGSVPRQVVSSRGGRPKAVVDHKAPEGALIESCCPARKCKKPAGHDNGVHDRDAR